MARPKGQGCIRQRTPGTWQLLYYVDGKKKAETVKGTKRDAERRMTEIQRAIDQGTWSAPVKMRMTELLTRWLEDCARPRLAVTTYGRYRQVIEDRLTPAIGDVPVVALRPMDIQALYSSWEKEGLSPGTRAIHHNVLRQALNTAVNWELIPKNPALSVVPPKSPRGARGVLTDEDMRRLLDAAARTRYYAPVVLAATTGMRVGEICGLRWEDVDLEERQLVVRQAVARKVDGGVVVKSPKTRTSARCITLPPIAVEALRGLAQDSALVFHSNGEPVNPRTISMGVHRLCRKLGLPTSIHGLRHSHASFLMRIGEHPKLVAERLGHSSVRFTMDVYTHTLSPEHRELAKRLQSALDAA